MRLLLSLCKEIVTFSLDIDRVSACLYHFDAPLGGSGVGRVG